MTDNRVKISAPSFTNVMALDNSPNLSEPKSLDLTDRLW